MEQARSGSQVAERIVRLEVKVEHLEAEVKENFDELSRKIDERTAELTRKMDAHLEEHKWLTRLLLGTLASSLAALALELISKLLR